jgi:hypothetical protein
LRKIETKIPFGELYNFMKKETITRRLSLVGGGCEDYLHTFTIKICTHIKPGWKWNYYVVVV